MREEARDPSVSQRCTMHNHSRSWVSFMKARAQRKCFVPSIQLPSCQSFSLLNKVWWMWCPPPRLTSSFEKENLWKGVKNLWHASLFFCQESKTANFSQFLITNMDTQCHGSESLAFAAHWTAGTSSLVSWLQALARSCTGLQVPAACAVLWRYFRGTLRLRNAIAL